MIGETTKTGHAIGLIEASRSSSLDRSSGITSHRTLTLECGGCGNQKAVRLKCGRRSCQECRQRQFYKAFKDWFRLVESMEHPKLLTLTIKNLPSIERTDVKQLRAQFIRLLRRKAYSSRILGGIYVVELTNKGKGWHLHIHALIETPHGPLGFIPQKKLSQDWKIITGTSMIVDVREVRSRKGALRYILKYLTKPLKVSGHEERYDALMRGFRLIQTFGTLYGVKPDRPAFACEQCGCTVWISEFQERNRIEVNPSGPIPRRHLVTFPPFFKQGKGS